MPFGLAKVDPARMSDGAVAERAADMAIDGAIALIERKGWTQGALARDERGRPISPFHKEAASFCVEGALFRSAFEICSNGMGPVTSVAAGVATLVAAADIAKDAAMERVCAAAGDFAHNWNDDPDRRPEEARELLLRARVHEIAASSPRMARLGESA